MIHHPLTLIHHPSMIHHHSSTIHHTSSINIASTIHHYFIYHPSPINISSFIHLSSILPSPRKFQKCSNTGSCILESPLRHTLPTTVSRNSDPERKQRRNFVAKYLKHLNPPRVRPSTHPHSSVPPQTFRCTNNLQPQRASSSPKILRPFFCFIQSPFQSNTPVVSLICRRQLCSVRSRTGSGRLPPFPLQLPPRSDSDGGPATAHASLGGGDGDRVESSHQGYVIVCVCTRAVALTGLRKSKLTSSLSSSAFWLRV